MLGPHPAVSPQPPASAVGAAQSAFLEGGLWMEGCVATAIVLSLVCGDGEAANERAEPCDQVAGYLSGCAGCAEGHGGGVDPRDASPPAQASAKAQPGDHGPWAEIEPAFGVGAGDRADGKSWLSRSFISVRTCLSRTLPGGVANDCRISPTRSESTSCLTGSAKSSRRRRVPTISRRSERSTESSGAFHLVRRSGGQDTGGISLCERGRGY
jgi:hypothetical protein